MVNKKQKPITIGLQRLRRLWLFNEREKALKKRKHVTEMIQKPISVQYLYKPFFPPGSGANKRWNGADFLSFSFESAVNSWFVGKGRKTSAIPAHFRARIYKENWPSISATYTHPCISWEQICFFEPSGMGLI